MNGPTAADPQAELEALAAELDKAHAALANLRAQFAAFRDLASRCRAKQREFFNPKTRTANSASDAIALERQVDRALKEHAAGPTLFDQEAHADA